MDVAREVRTQGSTILSQRQVFNELVGADVVRRALARMPPELREEYESATPISWVRASTVNAVIRAVAEESGRELLAFHAQTVRLGVERTLKTVWRLILRFTSDEALVARTPLLYSKTYDHGALTSRVLGPGRAEITLSGWPEIDELPLRSLSLGIEAVLQVAGRRDVSVTAKRTADGALYHAVWRAS